MKTQSLMLATAVIFAVNVSSFVLMSPARADDDKSVKEQVKDDVKKDVKKKSKQKLKDKLKGDKKEGEK